LQEHLHYDLVRSADPEFKKAIIQINIYKQHRQTIQVCEAVGLKFYDLLTLIELVMQ